MKSDVVDELFRKYYNDALLYIMSFTKNKDRAEEIVSTAFYKALITADDKVADFKPWLLKVCRNLFFNNVRNDKKRSLPIPENEQDKGDSPLDKLIKDENYKSLYNAISLLPDHQREVIFLFYFDGVSIAGICDIVGKSADNVKVILYRARERLKQILEKEL